MERTYVLFKEQKRLTVKDDDMTAEKIGRLFQVSPANLFLVDSANVAVFPTSSGDFHTFDLTNRGLYEVHGEGTSNEGPVLPGPASATGSAPVQRFSFARASSSSAPSTSTAPPRATVGRSFQRSVFMAEHINGKLIPNRMLCIRFTEGEANVPAMQEKVQEALGKSEPVRLTDGQGNELLDTEGTRGSVYWKPSARKILAVSEQDFSDLQAGKRKRSSISRKHEDEVVAMQDVYEKIEEVVLAAQSLQDVTAHIKALSDQVGCGRVYMFNDAQAEKVKEAFSCCVCKGLVKEPIFATCCRTIIGCRGCIQHCLQESSQCVKCRGENFAANTHHITGLADALEVLSSVQ